MKKVSLFRVLFVCLICLIFTSLVLVACSTPASTGAPKVLRFASFDSPKGFTSNAHQVFADELEKRTGGRYKVEIAWGGAMGKTEEHYELVRDGIADIGYFLTALSPGVFPMSDIISLPWVLPSSAESVPAFWEFYKQGHLDKELSK